MNKTKKTNDICRICLDENVVLDWNNMLYEYYGITYKDCYYKYTQLEYIDADTFSTMLCQSCLIGLQNIHTLILRAIESHKYFEGINSIHLQIEDETDIKCNLNEFETILIDEQVIDAPNEQLHVMSDKDFTKSRRVKRKKLKSDDFDSYDDDEESIIELNGNTSKDHLVNTRKRKSIQQNVGPEDNNKEKLNISDENIENPEDIKTTKNKKNKDKTSSICSFCSRVFSSKTSAERHERTHALDRERKETCEICGLKLFTKKSLLQHLETHDQNREKRHKCEFCPKAFYNKGGLNIHRRAHLGQMIPCTLCSKQFFRQHDLLQHMSSHSTIAINTKIRKRSKYYVHCKDCDKKILSTTYKAHKAAHLNTPLMKCSICDKEYFSRSSCSVHLKRIHKKSKEEFDDCIIVYKKDRISRLFIEQNEDIQRADGR